jgi:hypothetical protein
MVKDELQMAKLNLKNSLFTVWPARHTRRLLLRNVILLGLQFVLALDLMVLLPALPAAAQSFDAEVDFFVATPDEAQSFTVGDYITLRLQVRHPGDSQVQFPQLEEQWGQFEVIEQSQPTTVTNGDGTTSTGQDIIVALFEPGSYQTPRLVVTHTTSDGAVEELGAPVIPLRIDSVLIEGDEELRDLKAQADMDVPPLWPLILAAVLLALLLLGLMVGTVLWLLQRRKQKAAAPVFAVPVFDSRPPEIIAYDELERIRSLDLPAKSQFKEHYSLVTNCLRRYIEGRYHIHALERTTSEIYNSLTISSIPADAIRDFMNVFIESDLVKFARFRPNAQEAYSLVPKARAIVESTTPVPEPVREVPLEPETEVMA